MKNYLFAFAVATLLVGSVYADTINYNTTGSTLACDGIAGCIQNTSTSVTVGGLTVTYNTGSGSGVVTPSIINFGNLVTTGTGTSVNFTGLLLTLNVNSTPPGASGDLPNGSVTGTLSTNNSGAFITFGPNNTTTAFGTLPGVTLVGSSDTFIYQVLQTTLGIQAPTVGNPIGQTTIQGVVSEVSNPVTGTPEPASIFLIGTGLAGFAGAVRRHFRKA